MQQHTTKSIYTPLTNIANYPTLKIVDDAPIARPAPEGYITINTLPGQAAVKTFEILPLVKETDPILRQKAEPFVFGQVTFTDKERLMKDPIYLGFSLFETMFKHKGLGLSAPQCGISLQVLVLGADQDTKQVMFNPMIIQESPEIVVKEEGCLSYKHLFVKVPRSEAIRVSFQDARGQRQFQDFVGLTARIVQHEIDHLRGNLFWQRAGGTTVAMARERRKKLLKKESRQ